MNAILKIWTSERKNVMAHERSQNFASPTDMPFSESKQKPPFSFSGEFLASFKQLQNALFHKRSQFQAILDKFDKKSLKKKNKV